MNKIFSYGTLLEEDIQLEVFGRKIPIYCFGELKDFSVDKIGVQGKYPNLIPSNNMITFGAILELTDEELKKADEYEEVPLYNRVEKVIETAFGKIKAFVYIHNP